MKELTCIVCPNGCTLSAEEGPQGIRVSGNRCKRGEEFARNELTHPMRTITTTVRTTLECAPVLPVKVSAEIPKERIFDVMAEINKTIVTKPVARGSAVIQNVLGLHVDVIATSSLLMAEEEKNEQTL